MSVYSCGWSKGGQLGIGPCSKDLQKDPVLVEGLRGKRIIQVSCGDQSSFAITDLGDIYAWGRGIEGQLAQGNRKSALAPLRIDSLQHEKIIKISSGSHHCIALTSTGRVYTWGKLYETVEKDRTAPAQNDLGRLAGLTGLKQSMIEQSINRYLSAGSQEEEFHTYTTSKSYYQVTPLLMEELEDEFVVDISAGYSFSVVVTRSGSVYSWGFNDKAQLGLGNRYNQHRPRLVSALGDVHATNVVCGQQHTLVLTDEGRVWSWGLGVFGQLGHGTSSDSLFPRLIKELVDKGIIVSKIGCGAHHSVALAGGKVFSWGHGEYGQHGGTENHVDWGTGNAGGKDNHFSTPRELKGLEEHNIIEIACGHLHNVAITDSGACYTWGWGSSGCLGHGNTRFQLVPKRVTKFLGEKIIRAACSWKHSLFLQSSSHSSFAFDYENLVNSTQYSDIVFNVRGRPIFAHKVIVFARCPYLRSITHFTQRYCNVFDDEMGMTNIDVDNVTFPVFLGLIQYLYTDHLKLPPHQIIHLGNLAIHYRMPRLHQMCRKACRAMQSGQIKEDEIIQVPVSKFSEEMRESLNQGWYSDIQFKNTDGTIVRSHRAILTRRCEFFRSMFASGFRESGEMHSVISVDEYIEPEVFKTFLDFLYCGDGNVITPDNVCELLGAADRYMVEDLKQLTESIIEGSIDAQNVCWLLVLGDRYNANRLKRACLDEITNSKESLENIKQTEGYKDVRESMKLYREVDFLATKKNFGHF